jgi:hypothetical protein
VDLLGRIKDGDHRLMGRGPITAPANFNLDHVPSQSCGYSRSGSGSGRMFSGAIYHEQHARPAL